jgi:hypothetical protein
VGRRAKENFVKENIVMCTHRFTRIGMACGGLAILLIGCGDRKESTMPPATSSNPQENYQQRLNDPNASEAEKAQIRKYMSQSAGAANAPGGTSGGQ